MSDDKDILAALSSVCLDDNVNGRINESKREVAFLLPTDPVKNKKKRGHVHIYYVFTPSKSGKGKGRENGKWGNKALFKPGTRKNGVDLIY